MAVLARAPLRTIASTLVDQIREDIIRGELTPGSRLLVRELQERYDAGVNPIREALARLVSAGFVVVEDQRGFRVSPVSLQDLEDLRVAKCEVYPAALRASMMNGDVAWESRVLAAHHNLRGITPAPGAKGFNEDAYEIAHRAFHSALVDACGSTWLLHFVDVLFDQTRRYRHLAMVKSQSYEVASVEHERIMKAAISRDVARATRLMVEHIVVTSDVSPVSTKSVSPRIVTTSSR